MNIKTSRFKNTSTLERERRNNNAPIASYPALVFSQSDSAPGRRRKKISRQDYVLKTSDAQYREAADVPRTRERSGAGGADMNFWKGLLKQIAKCSVCWRTGGETRRGGFAARGNGTVSLDCATARLRFADTWAVVVPRRRSLSQSREEPENLRRRWEKNEFWRECRPREILPSGRTGCRFGIAINFPTAWD